MDFKENDYERFKILLTLTASRGGVDGGGVDVIERTATKESFTDSNNG